MGNMASYKIWGAGPVELGGRGGDRTPNISRTLPVFPEINPKIVKRRSIFRVIGALPKVIKTSKF